MVMDESNNRLKRRAFISHIVVAEFDIDSGSTVRHQYPSKIPNCKEDWLAENMLPEGVHNRDVDYTFIFLNRNSPHINDITEEVPLNETDIFLYGINLCQTKFDSNVRRGAIVKSMALFSPYNFVDILKIPLENALQLYFETPGIDILEVIFYITFILKVVFIILTLFFLLLIYYK